MCEFCLRDACGSGGIVACCFSVLFEFILLCGLCGGYSCGGLFVLLGCCCFWLLIVLRVICCYEFTCLVLCCLVGSVVLWVIVVVCVCVDLGVWVVLGILLVLAFVDLLGVTWRIFFGGLCLWLHFGLMFGLRVCFGLLLLLGFC